MVKKRDLYVEKYLIGLHDFLKHFEDTIFLPQPGQSRKPHILGIVGLGGA